MSAYKDNFDPLAKPHLAEWFLHPLIRGENRAFLWFLDGSRTKPMSYKEAGEWVNTYVRGLDALGIARGSRIISIGAPSPFMWLSTIGHALQGVINVAIPASLLPAEQMRLIYDSKAPCLLVENLDTLKQLLAVVDLPDDIKQVIVLQSRNQMFEENYHFETIFIDDLILQARSQPDRSSQKRLTMQSSETATIVCFATTSDDIGMSENSSTALKRSHEEWGESYQSLIQLGEKEQVAIDKENMLVMTDWHTSGAYAASYILPILSAQTLGFLPQKSPALEALITLQPTMLVANASTLERVKSELEQFIHQQGDWLERLTFAHALKAGKMRYEAPEKIRGWRKFYANLIQDIFIKTFIKRMGGKLKIILSVDEETPYSTQLFYYSFGIQVVEIPSTFGKQFEKRNW